MKTVSIAMATYNGAAYLEEQLQSLSKQTYPIHEVVVCDDQSKDHTVEILRRYANELPLRIHVNPVVLGITENFKSSVGRCTGEYIALCDQDDVWYPTKLESTYDLLTLVDSHNPTLVYTDLEVVDKELRTIAPSFWQLTARSPSNVNFVRLLLGNVVTGCTVMMNRAMATEMHRMPKDVEMHDFWLALVAYGIGRYAYLDKPTIKYRQHGSNVTSTEQVNLRTKLIQTGRSLLDTAYAPTYKLDAIRQGEQFLSLYGSQLSSSDRRALEGVVALKSKHSLLRIMYVMRIKYMNKL